MQARRPKQTEVHWRRPPDLCTRLRQDREKGELSCSASLRALKEGKLRCDERKERLQ